MSQNRIFNLDVIQFLNNFENNSIDLIIADPPYNIGVDKWDKFNSDQEYWSFMHKWLDLSILKLKKGGSIYIFNNQFNSAIILCYLKDKLKFNNWITWYKKDGFHPTKNKFVSNQETCLYLSKGEANIFNYDDVRIPYSSIKRLTSGKGVKGKNGKPWTPNPKGKLCTDVWEFSSERHSRKCKGKTIQLEHPTIKPSLMIERIIKSSTTPDSLVLDLFSGSGQTSLIAKKFNINSSGCELDKRFYNLIKKKINE